MDDPVAMEVVGVRIELPTNTPILLLREKDGRRFLPIWIGTNEATAIALALEGVEPQRPMTHDLLRDLMEQVGGKVISVVISELRDGTFYARVKFVHEGKEFELDSRPSDAVALAVRVEAPIFVSDEVLQEAGLPAEDDTEIDLGEVEEDIGELTDPFSNLERRHSQLEKAIADENYEKAAELRDEIQRLKTLKQ